MTRAASTNPIFLPPDYGTNEGDIFKRDGCGGSFVYHDVVNCICHINPPCVACVDNPLICDECGWLSDE